MNTYPGVCTGCSHDATKGFLKECNCKPNWYDTFEKSNVMQELRLRKQQRKLSEQDIVNTLSNNAHKFAALKRKDPGDAYSKAQEIAKQMKEDLNHELWHPVIFLSHHIKQYV